MRLFIQTCAPNMGLFLRERAPEKIDEMVQLIERYMVAHGGSINKSLSGPGGVESRPMRVSHPHTYFVGTYKYCFCIKKIMSPKKCLPFS